MAGVPDHEAIRRPRGERWTADEFAAEIAERAALVCLTYEMVTTTGDDAWADRLLGGGRNPWEGPWEWEDDD